MLTLVDRPRLSIVNVRLPFVWGQQPTEASAETRRRAFHIYVGRGLQKVTFVGQFVVLFWRSVEGSRAIWGSSEVIQRLFPAVVRMILLTFLDTSFVDPKSMWEHVRTISDYLGLNPLVENATHRQTNCLSVPPISYFLTFFNSYYQ